MMDKQKSGAAYCPECHAAMAADGEDWFRCRSHGYFTADYLALRSLVALSFGKIGKGYKAYWGELIEPGYNEPLEDGTVVQVIHHDEVSARVTNGHTTHTIPLKYFVPLSVQTVWPTLSEEDRHTVNKLAEFYDPDQRAEPAPGYAVSDVQNLLRIIRRLLGVSEMVLSRPDLPRNRPLLREELEFVKDGTSVWVRWSAARQFVRWTLLRNKWGNLCLLRERDNAEAQIVSVPDVCGAESPYDVVCLYNPDEGKIAGGAVEQGQPSLFSDRWGSSEYFKNMAVPSPLLSFDLKPMHFTDEPDRTDVQSAESNQVTMSEVAALRLIAVFEAEGHPATPADITGDVQALIDAGWVWEKPEGLIVRYRLTEMGHNRLKRG